MYTLYKCYVYECIHGIHKHKHIYTMCHIYMCVYMCVYTYTHTCRGREREKESILKTEKHLVLLFTQKNTLNWQESHGMGSHERGGKEMIWY